MKRLLLASAILSFPSVYAATGSGSDLTLGASSNKYSLPSALKNPAMTSLVIDSDESVRMSFFPSFGINTEIGQVDNFADDLEELADILDDPSSTNDDPSDVLERFNGVLVNVGNDGYINTSVQINLPLLPLVVKSDLLGGSIALDASVGGQVGMSILDDPLYYNDQNGTFDTASAIYLKSGIETNISLSYSRQAYKNSSGTLYAGGKIKWMNMELSKQLIPLVELANEDVEDIISDNYDKNTVESSDFGIDLGLVWDGSFYRVGFTAENLNSPEFAYGEVGVGCEDLASGSTDRSSCEVARYFAQDKGDIAAKEVHVKDPIYRLDGLLKLTETISFSAAYDLNSYNDIIGFEQQWVHSALSYDSDYFFLPSARIGYHKNLVGTETSSVSLGFTLFKYVSLDFEYGLDEVVIDDSKGPRRVGFALSVQENF